jgi:alpha-ketoglutarate-dependent taurine dioxygenase
MPPSGRLQTFSRSKDVKPQPIRLEANESLVRTSLLSERTALPLLVQPATEAVDLAEWAGLHRAWIDDQLHRSGAVLFRGFDVDSIDGFERFALQICDEIYAENGEHVMVSANVAVPVFYPRTEQLLWHNENSYNHHWPTRIIFGCAVPPAVGGETPLVDSRRVFERIPKEILDLWVTRGVTYQRNYGGGLGLDWRTVFKTDSREKVEEICRENRMEFLWKSGDRLRTRCIRPAVIRHPITGEVSWFNQGQHWHTACLDPETREGIETLFAVEDQPRCLLFGDGTPIPGEHMSRILVIYRELEVSIPWQRGDVVVVDNMLVAHGRNPFEGERKILVAMGNMKTYEDVA